MNVTATIAGVFMIAVIFSANNTSANAEVNSTKLALGEVRLEDAINNELMFEKSKIKKSSKQNTKKNEYIVKKGDSLVKIAKESSTNWQRLFDKNFKIDNPDSIFPGDKIIIPSKNEKLKQRNVPVQTKIRLNLPEVKKDNNYQTNSMSSYRGSSSGNTYTPGYCTYYVKNKRPNLPNNLGNASTWVQRAQAQGLPTGSKPRAGAVGQSGNHVVYVEKVNNNGTILISEMNWSGLWVITKRTVSASSHTYIY